MNQVQRALQSIASDLFELGPGFALVGGMAVSLRAEERSTRDIDLVVAVPNDAAAEALVRNLRERGYEVLAAIEQAAAARLATVRLKSTVQGRVVVDLLFASSGIEAEVVADAETLAALPGLTLPVARLPHLLALKVLAEDDVLRLQDRLDILSMLDVAAAEDLALCKTLLSLIEQRGFNRGKDLQRRFDELQELAKRRQDRF